MKGLIRLLVVGFFLLTIYGSVTAQQDAHYSMYMFNGLAINPAYAGAKEQLSLTGLYRHQWAGIEGAPKTVVLSGHNTLLNKKIGLGLSLVNDHIGVENMFNVSGAFAYRMFLGRGTLAAGLQATFMHYRARWDKLVYNDISANPNLDNPENLFVPNFGLGLYYNTDRFFAGLSVPHLLNNSLNEPLSLEAQREVARQYKHYFASIGYKFPLSDAVDLQPSLLFKYVHRAPLDFDVNALFIIKEALSLGVSFRKGAGGPSTDRFGDALVFMAQYWITKNLRAGYAYDLTLTELKNYNSGSHEIMIGYDFGVKYDRYLTPRRMTYY